MKAIVKNLSAWSPVLALVLLIGLPVVFSHPAPDLEAILARSAEVKGAFAEVPYAFGDWIGEDEAVPATAIEILRPNAVLCRRFRNISDGRVARLLVVHCSDARDMEGHYPPVCYPAHGWSPSERESARDCRLRVGDDETAARAYHFRRLRAAERNRETDWDTTETLRVFNFFLLPTGEMASRMPAVNQLRSSLSVRGVVQVQVAMTTDIDFDQALRTADELVGSVGPLLARLRFQVEE